MTRGKTITAVLGALALTFVALGPAWAWCHYNTNNFGPRNDPWTSVPVYIDLGAGDLRRTGLSEETLTHYVETILAEFNAASVTAPRLYFAGVRKPADLLYYGDLPDDSGIHIRAGTCAEGTCCIKNEDCEGSEDCDCSDDDVLCCDECTECSPNCVGGVAYSVTAQGEGKSLIVVTALQDKWVETDGLYFESLAEQGVEICNSFEPFNTMGGPPTSACVNADADCSQSQQCESGVYNPNKGYCIPYKDFEGVLMHEMAHSMGLGHAEWDFCQCEVENDGTHSGDAVETYGVVRTNPLTGWGAGKKLYRDDIEGLRALFAPADLPDAWTIYRWMSEDGVDWSLPVIVPQPLQQSSVPPAASSTVDADDSFQVIAFADESAFVRHYTRDNGGWDPLDINESRVDQNTLLQRPTDNQFIAAGRTFHRVATAYAPPVEGVHPGRIIVAWFFEDTQSFKANIRWGIRDRDQVGPGAWCYSSFLTRYRTDIGLGYDPLGDRFLLTHLDAINNPGYPNLRSIDPVTCQASDPVVLKPGDLTDPEGLHDIGKPVCSVKQVFPGPARTECVIPISTLGENGPCLGWYFGELPDGPLATLDDDDWEREIYCLRNSGQGDLSRDPQGQNGFVGTLTYFFRGPDPIADQSFLCNLPGCGLVQDATTQSFVRYKLKDPSDGFSSLTLGQGESTLGLSAPTDFGFVPDTSAAQPGQPDPSAWWPAGLGSIGDHSDRFRLYRTLGPVCGNGIVEAGEQCDGGTGGLDCTDFGFEGGTLRCVDCALDSSDCSDLDTCPPGSGPGDPGCECIEVQSCPGSLEVDGCFPDGPGSFLGEVDDDYHGDPGRYCPDVASSSSGLVVCAPTLTGLSGGNPSLTSFCQTCPDLPGNGTAGYGCPCTSDTDCAPAGHSGPVTGSTKGLDVDLACWGGTGQGWSAGQGVCHPEIDPAYPQSVPVPMAHREEFERTRWLCKSTCDALEDSTNVEHHCHFNQTWDFVHASCIEDNSCTDTVIPGECDHEQQGRCDLDDDTCSDECNPLLNGTTTEGGNMDCLSWGYPGYWQCAGWADPPRCVVPECEFDPIQQGLDISECRQFLHGEPGPP